MISGSRQQAESNWMPEEVPLGEIARDWAAKSFHRDQRNANL